MVRLLRKAGIPIALTLAAVALGLVLYAAPLASLPFANRIADLQIHAAALANPGALLMRGAPDYNQPNDDIALVAIDEPSLRALGQFPFPRGLYGAMLRKLKAAGARVVAFDIDFLNPAPDPAQDRLFSDGGRLMPAVIGYSIDTTTRGIGGATLPPPFLQRVFHIGHTSVDSPGAITIGTPLQLEPMPVPGGVAKALALQSVELFGARVNLAQIPTLHGEALIVPFDVVGIPDTQHLGDINWNVPFTSGGLESFSDVLHLSASDLATFCKGKIVFVGSTAAALSDLTGTLGTDERIPGMFLHARLADQLLTGTFLRPAPDWLSIALIVLLPFALTGFVMRVRPLVAMPVAAASIAVYVEISLALFVYKLYWINTLHVAGSMLLAALGVIAYRAIGEAAQRRAVTTAFALHVSHEVVQELLKHEGEAKAALAGKRAKVTVFYSDIRGFTSMSEKLSPEAVYEQLNEYFEAMCDIIFHYGGYVDKFIGDCIMAIFSAPNPTPGDARKAVEAALDQQAVIEQLAQRWREAGKPPLAVGMGINTGYVVMGNLGSHKRMNYTVIGDDVNVAARLYNVAAGGQIIISESTYEEVKDFFVFRELEPVSVKGKSAPLRTFEVIGRRVPDDGAPISLTEVAAT